MPVRILHLVASSRGGGAVHMRELIRGLAQLDHPVVAVMPLDDGNVESEDFQATGVRFIPLPYPIRYPGHWAGSLVKIFKTESPTIVHAHGSRSAFWAYWALLWAGLWKTRLVVSIHGFTTPFHRQPRRLLQLTIERLVAHRASAIIAVAEAEREALLRARVAPPAKVFTVRLGFDLSPFTSLAAVDRRRARETLRVPSAARLLLTICRLDRPRDFQILLNAFRQVADADTRAHLYVVGGGPLQTEVESLVKQWRLTDRVKLWGFRGDVATFYAAADIFVLTSWGWEGLPTTVIEAQAAGIPVVVTDAGGSEEAFLPAKTGLLVPQSDPKALARALLSLAADPARRRQMGLIGREFATANFGLERMVEQIVEIYRSLL